MLSSLLALALLVGLAGPDPSRSKPAAAALDTSRLLTAADRRVRTTNARIQSLLIRGATRSSTFAALVAALSRTDVIVYIEPVRDLPATIAGRLLLLPLAAEGQRYLRIQIAAGGTTNELISTIAHELQHALEIAGEPEVRDQPALVRLYERIGKTGIGGHTFDTTAAQTAGRVVRRELIG